MGGLRTEPSSLASGSAVIERSRAAWWRGHGLFLILLALGAVLRAATALAFGSPVVVPATGVFRDATSGQVAADANLGYTWLALSPLARLTEALQPVVLVQHLLGLALAVALYALLTRWGVWRWLAAVATLPLLLGPSMLMAEQLVLPDSGVVVATALATVSLLWRRHAAPSRFLIAGLLIGVTGTLAPVGAALLVTTIAAALLLGATGRSRVFGALAVLVGCCVVFGGYVVWQQNQTTYDASDLAATGGLTGWSSVPLAQASDLLTDRAVDRASYDLADYRDSPATAPPIDALASYADLVGGPVWPLLPAPLLGLAAALGVGRARHSRMRTACALTSLLPVAVIVAELAAGDEGWHTVLPAIALWPAAGALGVTALLRGRRGADAVHEQVDDVDLAAQQEFRERCGAPQLAPVAVVIAAYNEGSGLPRVLDAIPDNVCDIRTDVIVVDDGSNDDTVEVALAHAGVHLVRCPANRGQGAALRLGYRMARDHGAEFILTTDGDGQYDTADFPSVLEPILQDRADFVTGSRRLGHQHTFDRFRRLGVHVFAWIISAMVGQRLTDTSFGLRAMRAEATAAVTLNQPQYQSSELLLGMFSHGYRVLEVPGTMHQRTAGSTKKGRNLVYGSRYARVVFGTWWREGCPWPATERAAALRNRQG